VYRTVLWIYCNTTGRLETVLLRDTQLTFVQRFQQLYFLIHYCYTMKVHASNAVRRSGAPHMYWPHLKSKFCMKTPFTQSNLSSIEHLLVEYHVPESLDTTLPYIRLTDWKSGLWRQLIRVYNTNMCILINDNTLREEMRWKPWGWCFNFPKI
jgi:hypothetical protein